jgi:histidine decarboxylase
MTTRPFSLADVVNGAVGPLDRHCMGYLNPGASGQGYVNTMKLSVSRVEAVRLDAGMEQIYSEIYSYDRCEIEDAYIGQTNGLTATSFSGLNGAIWGVHLARATTIADGTLSPMFTMGGVPVYPIGPILNAAERLFGRVDRHPGGPRDLRRFPPLPGAHIISANKDAGTHGPGWAWSAIALGLVRQEDDTANLFMEDAGVYPGEAYPDRAAVVAALSEKLRRIARAMMLWREDRAVDFTRIYAGAKYIFAGPGQWGLSLTCIPYVLLARDAVPSGRAAADLLTMTIDEWEADLRLAPLPPAPAIPDAGGVGC